MESCGGDLKHFLGLALSMHSGKIRIAGQSVTKKYFFRIQAHRPDKSISVSGIPPEISDQLRKRPDADHLDPVHHRAFSDIA